VEDRATQECDQEQSIEGRRRKGRGRKKHPSEQKKQKKIWVPAYDYDADGNIVVFGDAIVDADAASRFIGTPDEFEFIGTEDEVEVES